MEWVLQEPDGYHFDMHHLIDERSNQEIKDRISRGEEQAVDRLRYDFCAQVYSFKDRTGWWGGYRNSKNQHWNSIENSTIEQEFRNAPTIEEAMEIMEQWYCAKNGYPVEPKSDESARIFTKDWE